MRRRAEKSLLRRSETEFFYLLGYFPGKKVPDFK